jgi:asparagine synthase (glutamine-hydrolysing)
MCGIFGAYNRTGDLQAGVLEKAVCALAHRGPDDQGVEVIATNSGGQLGLAHTRLSIIDLSPLGHQPMHDPTTGNWIVFNGEIYNFRELRVELEAAGHQFHTHSDTEVILAAYRALGDDSVLKLRGMFAFALWDAARQRLLLARDPLGIKPLYYCRYCRDETYFLFASEVRTLLETNLVPRKLDSTGLLSYLAFGSVYEPWTIIDGVSAVPPGHVVTLENGKIESREYWNALQAANADAHSPDATIQSLPSLLREAVLSHLVSDVPVGVFLSGGIDSSALVAVMSQAGVRPTTFSLVFREEEFNEAAHSRQVAERFKTDHHEIMVSQQDALNALPDALRAMDQPTIDGINTWLISAKTRAVGIKVALTGLGADEMFAGYSNFRRAPQMERAAARFRKLPSALRRPVAASIARVTSSSDRNRKFAELASGADSTIHPYFLARTLFTPKERESLYAGDYATADHKLEDSLRDSVTNTRDLDPINRVSYLESHWYMRNTLLRDSDFMSMSHALELRVPFLDRALVEACFRIPGKAKLQGDAPKTLLLRSLGVELPDEIVHRPKRGFTLPFERWLRAEMKPLVETMLQRNAAQAPGLDPQAVAEVWNRFLDGKTSWSRPWSLFVLQSWCERNL